MNSKQRTVREFVVVSYARTGSSQLTEYINQFPKTKCFPEVFKTDFLYEPAWEPVSRNFSCTTEAESLHRNNALQFWLKLRDSAYVENDRVGAKIFYYHRTGDDIWNHLLSREVGIIHLTRSSIIESFISLQLAQQTGVWSLKSPNLLQRMMLAPRTNMPIIEFDIAKYIEYRDYVIHHHNILSMNLASNPQVLNIEYKQISDTTYMGKILSEFFGIKSRVRQTLSKQSFRDPLKHVINRKDATPFANDKLPTLNYAQII